MLGASAHATEFSLSVADIVSPAFSARGIALTLPENGSADLRIAELKVQQRDLRNVRLHCAALELSTARMICRGGSLETLPGMALEFSYQSGNGVWQLDAQLRNTPAKPLAAFLPPHLPLPTQGALNGTFHLRGNAFGADTFKTDLQVADVGFSDTSGLHAAEKLRGSLRFSAMREASRWNWQGDLVWQSGDMFWQPLFLRGGYKLNASGSFDGTLLKVDRASADLPDAGREQFTAQWDVKRGALTDCTAHGSNLAVGKLFADFAKPFLGKGALGESAVYGQADVDWQYRNGMTQALRVVLRDAGIADAAQRFELVGVDTAIDWRLDASRTADISFGGGNLLGVPFGGGKWTVQMQGMDFKVAQAELPVLDGKVELSDLHALREKDQWRWQFAASIHPISMEQFSKAAGWPKMLGMFSGRIPMISYDGTEIKADGALLFEVFDGTVVATQLKLVNPFGRAPLFSGNLSMRNLDLDLLTRTFSFGNMQGRIDVDVNNLELQDWQPVQFDARVFSSPGNYPRKISQKAVENISALGGAGAVAALQRSYLSFFKNFGYERIGWSCKLRNDVCLMGGVDDGSGMNYVLIKGGGIPAITVMGYNRYVGWDELLTRLKRVTQGNLKPIVK
ncbi:MAG TPA: hypothetical protein VFK88_04135 [Gallionella sp.]|nr:hypothetical protein [Gallionella sp.]